MEFEDWGPVIAHIEHDHFTNREAVARALSITLMGDDLDWLGHMTNAERFIKAMANSMPAPPVEQAKTEENEANDFWARGENMPGVTT